MALPYKNIFFLFTSIIILFISVNSYSQELSTGEQEVKTKAAELFKEKKYNDALPYFSQLLSLYPKDPDYNYKYGVCLVITNKELENAITYLSFAATKDVPANSYFYLGKAYHNSYKFDDAIKYYNRFKEKGSKSEVKELLVDLQIEMCNNGKELIRYISDLIVLENKQIKSNDFYRSYEIRDFGGQILVAPEDFKSKADKSDEATLMFLSEKLGAVYYASYGKSKENGKDIFRRYRNPDGSWSEPESLGAIINTPYDEDFPYIHPDGVTLYFCSKGHNSMGGYDVYRSIFNENTGEWGTPENLDFPTNSPYDDIMFATDASEDIAYFASTRETSGELISVYKIHVDKNPIEKEVFDLEKVIEKSKLEVSPLVENLQATENTTLAGTSNLNMNLTTEDVDFNSYTFAKLNISDNTTTEDLFKEAEKDAQVLKKQASEIKKDADYSYVIANNKNIEADKRIKDATDYRAKASTTTSEAEKQEFITKAEKLEIEAEELSKEAIVSYNIAKNLENVATEKEKEAEDVVVMYKALQANDNADVIYVAEQINKKRENLTLGKNKYTDFDSQVEERKVLIKDKSAELETALNNAQEVSKETSSLKNELQKLEADLNNDENAGFKEQLQTRYNDVKTNYDAKKAEEEKLLSSVQKLKVEVDDLNTEVEFLEAISSDETNKEEIAAKVTEVNKENLNNQINEKEFIADSKTNEKVTTENKEIDEVVFSTNQTITESKNNTETTPIKTENSVTENNAENLYKQAETNKQVVDSLQYMISEKKKELENITDEAEKEKLQNEIDELDFLVDMKKTQAEKNITEAQKVEENIIAENKTTTNTETKSNPVDNEIIFPFGNNVGGAQQEYEKELFKAQYHEKVAESYSKNLETMKSSLDTISNPETKKAIEGSIRNIEKEIATNKTLADNSLNKAHTIKSENPNDVVDTEISPAELLKKATAYNSVKEIPLDTKQKDQIETAPHDREFAESTYQNFEKYETQAQKKIEEANKAEKQSAKNKILKEADEIITKADNEFHLYNETYALVNSEEFEVYNEVIEDNRIVAENADLKHANSLANEANIYFDKAKVIRKNADLIEDRKLKTEELVKAKDLELLAINKQKQAIDLYVKAKEEGVQPQYIVSSELIGNNTTTKSVASKDNTSTQEITLLYEEEENLKKFRDEEYKANTILNGTTKQLADIEKEKEAANLIMNDKKKQKALELIKVKEDAVKDKLIEAYVAHGQADSLKYSVYKNQIEQLASPLANNSNKKILTKQYSNEAEFYYTEAQKLREQGEAKTAHDDKIKDLKKATELEKKALSSQEVAVNIMMDVDPVMFASNNELVKLDILENLNKPVSTVNIEVVEEKKILEQINLTKDDIDAIDLAKEKQEEADVAMKEADLLLKQADEMKALATELTSAKAKKKALKEAEKVEQKGLNQQFNAAETYELVNNTKFSIYEDYVKNVRINDNTNEARQGKVLEKQANQKFYKAKAMRDRYYASSGKNQNIKLLDDANKIELEAIQDMKKAYRIYLHMPSIDSIQKRDSLLAVSAISEDMLIRSTGNVTTIGMAKSDTLVNNGTNNDLADNNTNNTEVVNETKTTNATNNNVEPTNDVAENTTTNNTETEIKTTEIKTTETKTTNETQTTPVASNANGDFVFGFSIFGDSQYSDANPIPINVPIPDCIIFKIQVGAFVNPIPQTTFKGLYPMTGEKLPNSQFTRYFVGMFRSIEASRLVLNEVKNIGFKDAFIVAYIDGNKVSQTQAVNLINAGKDDCVSGYDQIAQNEMNMVRNKVTTGTDVASNVTATNTNKTVAETVGRNVVSAQDITTVNGLLYTVQIGVYKSAPTSDRLKNLSPIYQQQTESGFIRFTTGIFDNYNVAKAEKDKVVNLGINDAFVAAYKDGQRISLDEARKMERENSASFAKTESISAPENNTTPTNNVVSSNDIIFKVQIGAYEKQVPTEVVTSLLKASAMKDFEQKVINGVSVYSVGKFTNYNDAVQLKNILVNDNIPDAFVVAYQGDKKITVEEAKKLLNQ